MNPLGQPLQMNKLGILAINKKSPKDITENLLLPFNFN
jgi:hypothetical protein